MMMMMMLDFRAYKSRLMVNFGVIFWCKASQSQPQDSQSPQTSTSQSQSHGGTRNLTLEEGSQIGLVTVPDNEGISLVSILYAWIFFDLIGKIILKNNLIYSKFHLSIGILCSLTDPFKNITTLSLISAELCAEGSP
jgi:hypothetical protein